MSSTEDVSPQEAKRIIEHMNRDHADSLEHYLEYYGRVSPKLARQTPTLTSLTTAAGMTITYGPVGNRSRFLHQFSPPMKAGQARTRLEQMHQDARKGLGLSAVRINRFDLDAGATSGIAFTIVLFALVASARADQTLKWLGFLRTPAERILDLLGNARPSADDIALAIKALVLGTYTAAHVAEIFVQLAAQLKRFNVEDTAVRRKWQLATLFGGFPVWMRLRAIGEKEERAAAKKA